MLGGIGVGKKAIRRREEQRYLEGHLDRIRNVRPSTTDYILEQIPRALNNSKKIMLMENKFTEIERENRLLLQKITTNLIKRSSKQLDGRQRMNKSLHSSFRKKQLVGIEIQNARLLKRLQEKKSEYETQKMKEDWKKQKVVIKNIANFPIIIGQSTQKERRRTFSKGFDLKPSLDKNKLSSDVEMMRIRTIDGVNMVVTIRLGTANLTILADLKRGAKDLKIIEVPREEALQFIQEECDGKIEGLFDRLCFDPQGEVLYLLSKQAQERNPEQNDVNDG